MTFAGALAHGHGRLEFVFHVGGMPWAVASSADMVTALTNANKRVIFGSETYNGGSNYWADDVDVYPMLERVDAQTISVKDGLSNLDGGTWSAKIADGPVRPTLWTHGTRNIWGLEGLASVANPRVDGTIAASRIAKQVDKADTSVTWSEDYGAALYTKANAASAAAPKVAWIGGECLAFTTAVDNSDGSYTGTTASGLRGLLNSKKCHHYVNNYDSGSPAEAIVEYPLNGLIGRPYYLWAFILNDANTIAEGPVKYRHGKVGGVEFDDSVWSVQCLPWWKWLDTELAITPVIAHMDKYVFSRPDTDWGGLSAYVMPHLRFWEAEASSDIAANVSTMADVWLCSEGQTVTYDTIEELNDALISAINTASPNSWEYHMTPDGPRSLCAGSEYDFTVYWGMLPFVLGWCKNSRKPDAPISAEWIAATEDAHARFADACSTYTWPLIDPLSDWYNKSPTDFGTVIPPSHPYSPHWSVCAPSSVGSESSIIYYDSVVYPEYILQWWYQPATCPVPFWGADESWMPDPNPFYVLSQFFPVPEEQSSGEPKIYVKPEYNIQTLIADEFVRIGGEDYEKKLDSHTNFGDIFDHTITPLSTAKVASVGAGGASANYIVPAFHSGMAAIPSIMSKCVNEEVAPKKLFSCGEMMFYNKALHERDPWEIAQYFDISGGSLGSIFKAILGETVTGVSVPEAVQSDHIPDYDTVDWSGLDALVSSCDFDVTFKLRHSGNNNLWKMLIEELKFYGISPTYVWSETLGQNIVGFRKSGAINATAAYLGGVTIDDSVTDSNTKVVSVAANDWQINSMTLKINWDSVNQKYEKEFEFLDHSSYSPTGGKINTISIEPTVTHVPNISTNLDAQAAVGMWFGSMLDSLMYPRPSTKISATMANSVHVGVGSVVLLTSDAVRNPWTGEAGVTNVPVIVSEVLNNPSKSECSYTMLMSPRLTYGWAPSLLATTLTDQGGNTWRVTAIGGSGQAYCGTGVTVGWYDHWFFCDCIYNSTMATPELQSSDSFYVTAIQYGSATPTIINNIKVNSVTLSSYADVIAAGGYFLELYDSTGVLSNVNDWYLTFAAHNVATTASQQKRYVYVASSAGLLSNSDATVALTREWT